MVCHRLLALATDSGDNTRHKIDAKSLVIGGPSLYETELRLLVELSLHASRALTQAELLRRARPERASGPERTRLFVEAAVCGFDATALDQPLTQARIEV